MNEENTLTPIKFNFYSLRFVPYKNEKEQNTTTSIVKDAINYIFKQKLLGKGHLIDRNKNRKNEERRELFMTSAVFMHKERRIRCSIALLRNGRTPKLKPKDDFKLVPITQIGTIAEETHFYIDYSRHESVICMEYNHHGPRITDIEYYLRNIAGATLKLSKATEINVYMDTSIDKTLKSLKNVLNLDIKIQPNNFGKIDRNLKNQYFSGMDNFSEFLKPQYIKLEALFQTSGKSVESKELNNNANKMVIDLLSAFKSRPFNIEAFNNFVVKYEDKEGAEEVFNLLKGKKEIIKDVDLSLIKKKREYYELIEEDFDNFINSLDHVG